MLVRILKDTYSIDWYGFQYVGMPINMQDYNLFSLLHISDIESYVKQQKYAHIIYIRNTWIFSAQNQVEPVRYFRETSKDIIVYSPVEEQLLPKRFFYGYGEFYDRLMTMTNTGKETIKKYGYEADVLYHYFLPDKKATGKSQDAFLNISYSQDYRKNLGMYFYLASKYPDKPFIYYGKTMYYVLNDYLELYNIKNMHFPYGVMTTQTSFKFISDTELANLYGISKYYLQTSYKEGFDLTVMEALINGLIVFMNNDALHNELFAEFPNAVFVNGGYIVPEMNQFEYFALPEEWIDKIDSHLYDSKRGYHLPYKFTQESVSKSLENILNKKN
jgi:hypothetical protein